jgi:hypothetical protein
MTTPHTPLCLESPLEIWALMFTVVDEFDLRVACRQVSQTIRAGVEREFTQNRVQHMEIFASAEKGTVFLE